MTERFKHRQTRGFSLIETLAVVAILVILLSVSAVAAAYYRDYLKITELDNAAREIYMAAENRAVLLDGGGQLDGALGVTTLAEGGIPAQPVFIQKDEAGSRGLLTAGAIDPALLDGDFYIFYDPSSGAVTDVFYAEKPINLMGASDASAFYADWSTATRDTRMRPGGAGPMLGYYGGEQQARDPHTPLPAPEVMVEIDNAERLTVKVTFKISEAARKLMGSGAELENNARRTVTLNYPGMKPITLFDSRNPAQYPASCGGRLVSESGLLASGSVSYVWVLDELDTDEERSNGHHFHELFGGKTGQIFGEDFTVSAELTLSAGGYQPVSASGEDTDNSLFAAHSGGETARLENVRHLQNLDTATSLTGKKTAAVQLADIDCYSATPYPNYEFVPIENADLTSFSGGWSTGEDGQTRRNEILDLHVTEQSAKGKDGAGLFAETEDEMTFTGVRLIDAEVSAPLTCGALAGVAGNNTQFKDIRVVNASVDSKGTAAGGVLGRIAQDSWLDKPYTSKFEDIHIINTRVNCAGGAAGGVAGAAYDVYTGAEYSYAFDNCRVYWEPEEGQQNLRSLLGSDNPEKEMVDYAITGKEAGGLVGKFTKEFTTFSSFSNCLAATTIHASAYAGGMVGFSESNDIVSNSYTDCYLSGNCAAGLIGQASSSLNTENVYTAGFIDMGQTQKAAGFCLGPGNKVETLNSYTAVYYPRLDEDNDYTGQIYHLTETQDIPYNDTFINTFYLEVDYGQDALNNLGGQVDVNQKAQLIPYSGLADEKFPEKLNKNAFDRKTAATSFPYNLQEDLKLEVYSFPGLQGLPHYGDWGAEFSKPSLVYYEDYGGQNYGFSGGNARSLRDDLTILSDGYAVAFSEDELGKNPSIEITYTYLTYPEDPDPPKWETVSQKYDSLLQTELNGKTYYLAPLPDELINAGVTSPDFFQYLLFEAKSSADNKSLASGESFYSPHFAETVNPYVPEDGISRFIAPGTSAVSAAQKISEYASQLIAKRTHGAVSVRTPRHLFNLSKFPDYYSNGKHRLTFQQELDLDGGTYTGYSDFVEHRDGVQLQSRIGTETRPFLGVYNGNSRVIRKVDFKIPDEKEGTDSLAIGLFGYSNGTLRNIVYDRTGIPQPSESFQSSEKPKYLGALAGRNGNVGSVENCAVEGARADLRAYSASVYAGGLVGCNEGRIQNSAAECALISLEGSSYAKVYAGGLAGLNQGENASIRASYAVGRLSAKAEKETDLVRLGGLVGQNSSAGVSYSYSAMDLVTDGAGAEAFGFCRRADGGRLSRCFYLNRGNFTYRDQVFLADYNPELTAGTSAPYAELTAGSAQLLGGQMGPVTASEFPYPSGVKNGAQNYFHYGQWPEPLNLGRMGVYYWEELAIDGKSSYHVRLLAVDPGETAGSAKTVTEFSNLSSAHDDHSVVSRFGYGFYNETYTNAAYAPSLDTENLWYFNGSQPQGKFDDVYQTLTDAKNAITQPDDGNPLYRDKVVDEYLVETMSVSLAGQYEFHSFHTLGLDKSRGGLYPENSPEAPNSRLTLTKTSETTDKGTQTTSISFVLNPQFAGALAVELPKNGNWSAGGGVPVVSAEEGDASPGTKGNPYGVRSIDQLELINWNTVNLDTHTAIHTKGTGAHSIGKFPYLSSGDHTGKFFWTQTHDIKGVDGQLYTPIAEYYDNTNTDEPRGYLEGWFGGEYNGQGYTIENVSINDFSEEQQKERLSSCAGLFGVVYNGTLKNILLYSSSGENTVKSIFNPSNSNNSQWYAIGALAGVAASHNGQSAIENCAVSGYRIETKAFTAKTTDKSWGGVGVGGLLGLSNMSLTGCSAVTEIKLVEGSKLNDNMRVGGLVGSCQGSVKNCYSGGSISFVNEKGEPGSVSGIDTSAGIYIGGLVGGSYMKPLQIGNDVKLTIGFVNDEHYYQQGSNGNWQLKTDGDGWTSHTLTNCYTYVRLPKLESGDHKIRGLFAVGGAGEIDTGRQPKAASNHGISIKENCYYLENEVLCNNTRAEIIKWAEDSYNWAKDIRKNAQTGYCHTDLADTNYKVGTSYDEWNIPFSTSPITINRQTSYYMQSDPLRNGTRLFTGTGSNRTFQGWLGNYNPANGTGTLITSRDSAETGVTALTYEQLSGQAAIPAKNYQTIYPLLPEFKPVDTTSDDGITVSGKYSYPPTITHPELQDRDYPFPTILTKDGEDGTAHHVHYGEWPLSGFRRAPITDPTAYLGGSPIELDLFNGGTHQENLLLTSGVPAGGSWGRTYWTSGTPAEDDQVRDTYTVTGVCARAEIAAGSGPNTFLLTVTPLKAGTDVLFLSYKAGGISYTLRVTVHVTAGVKLQPNRLCMFPDDTVEITLRAASQDGTLLTDGILKLRGNPVCGEDSALTAQTIRSEQTETEFPGIRLTTAGAAEGQTLMANAGFEYAPHTDSGDGDIQVSVIQPWTAAFPEPAEGEARQCVLSFPHSYSLLNGEGQETGVLRFEGIEATVISTDVTVKLEKREDADATVFTLTYGEDAVQIPATRLSVSLTMTEGSGSDPQAHRLTLTVEEPEEQAEVLALPELPGVEAPPPAAPGGDVRRRRRETARSV